MAYSSPPEVYFVAAPHARSVRMREWVFLGVVNNASKFAMIVVLVVGDAYALGKKARIVGKVECAREEAALS